jgi:hypothetical protein
MSSQYPPLDTDDTEVDYSRLLRPELSQMRSPSEARQVEMEEGAEEQHLLGPSNGWKPSTSFLQSTKWIEGRVACLGVSVSLPLTKVVCAQTTVQLPKSLLYLFAVPIILWVLSYFIPRPRANFPALPDLSNGTHVFHPTVILLSLDGFRASYLTSHRDLLPDLDSFWNSPLGLRSESMQPVFPSLTFPNHWAIMTGLYPAWSGIVANDFWDPDFETRPSLGEGNGGGDLFHYTDTKHSWNSNWWWGEPIWSVCERGGRKVGNLMWYVVFRMMRHAECHRAGPPVTTQGVSASYFVPFDVSSSPRSPPPADK